jgi:hypothetical protein
VLGPRWDHSHPAGYDSSCDHASGYDASGYDASGYDASSDDASSDDASSDDPTSDDPTSDDPTSDDPASGQLGYVMRLADTNSRRYGEGIDQR